MNRKQHHHRQSQPRRRGTTDAMSGPRYAFRQLGIEQDVDLALACAPAWWLGDRSPRHAWIDGQYVAVERRHGRLAWHIVRQPSPGHLKMAGEGSDEPDIDWATRVLRLDATPPTFTDPVIASLAARMPGLRPLSDGSLFEGMLTAVIGQSVSLASAAAAQRKLSEAFGDGVELLGRRFMPLPSAEDLAETSVEIIRASGVTGKRAEAIRHIAREHVAGNLPSEEEARRDPDAVAQALMDLPMVGPWTAESVLLWGVGAVDSYPPGDVALLRAARLAYEAPGMTMRDLDALSDGWRPGRAIAARLLWTNLLGNPHAG